MPYGNSIRAQVTALWLEDKSLFPFTVQLCCRAAFNLLFVFLINAMSHPLIIRGVNELWDPGNLHVFWTDFQAEDKTLWSCANLSIDGAGERGCRALPPRHQPGSLSPETLPTFCQPTLWISRKLNLNNHKCQNNGLITGPCVLCLTWL